MVYRKVGGEMSIEYLIEKYSKLIYKICYDMLLNSLDAEDITQEVYVSFYSNFERYGNLPEKEIKNIICKIALNKCKDVLKSKSKKLENMTTDNILLLENYIDERNIEQDMMEQEKREIILNLVDSLKSPYNKILRYYYLEELSLDEIVEKLNIPKTTLKMQIYRGKKILKEKLKEVKGDELL